MTTTFAQDIEEAADGEPILSIVIGSYGGYWWNDDDKDSAGLTKENKGHPISWLEARPLLNYMYDSGYGGVYCHAITAWTENYVLFVSQYDGSTNVCRVPRNPVDHQPDMPGGG